MSDLSKAWDHATGQVNKTVKDIGDEGNRVIHHIIDGANDICQSAAAIFDEFTIGFRGLRGPERDLLGEVYETSLPPLHNIFIISLSGMGGRPFTIPASYFEGMVGMLFPGFEPALQLALVELIGKRADQYILFLGKDGYNDAINGFPDRYTTWDTGTSTAVSETAKPGETLVHEACHVWQGYNQAFSWMYIFNAIYNQCIVGGAYILPDPPDWQWAAYGAEQQAMIVQSWFHSGQKTVDEISTADGPQTIADPLYNYIAGHVRAGRP
jgi:hypothetical protein